MSRGSSFDTDIEWMFVVEEEPSEPMEQRGLRGASRATVRPERADRDSEGVYAMQLLAEWEADPDNWHFGPVARRIGEAWTRAHTEEADTPLSPA